MAKFKSRQPTPHGTPNSAKRRRIAWMDDSGDENDSPRKDSLQSLTAKLDTQTLTPSRPKKKLKVAGGHPSSSKQVAIQEQRKQLPISRGACKMIEGAPL